MDERQTHLGAGGQGQQTAGRMRQAPPWSLHTDGGREYHMLLEEGHYRCPHCRRADALEMSGDMISRR